MTKLSKSHLLATSAVAGLAMLQLTPSAQAQDSFGVHNDQPEKLVVTVEAGETVEGEDIGIYADNGPVEVENDGTIRGNGPSQGGAGTRPSGGIVIAQPNSTVHNNGEISGAANGVVTSQFFGEDENDDALPPQSLAENTSVTNAGVIRGEAGTGVGLVGGGTVVNSGTIQGLNGGEQQAQGVGVALAEFPDATRDDVTGIGSVTNAQGGVIEGEFFGVVVAGGGTIDNAGAIRSTGGQNPNFPGQSPFAVVMTANSAQTGRVATLNNSGTVEGALLGILANASLESATINNSGVIHAGATAVFGGSAGDLVVNNAAGGQITSNGFVTVNSANGTLTVDNAGLIRSDGNAAITIATPDAQISNSGTIQGNTHGIVTGLSQLPGESEPTHRAVGTDVVNSGSIIGMNNDAIRLIGGGTVVNSGVIQGVNAAAGGTDGVSMFAAEGQDLAAYEASVTNAEGGQIIGDRSGVALSSGGAIDNAGEITGAWAGALIQNGLDEDGVDGTIANSGTIRSDAGEGIIGFGRIDTFAVTNSGTVTGGGSDGVYVSTYEAGEVVIDNAADGLITGAGSGVQVDAGQLTLTNAGSIRGEGRGDGVNTAPDGGVAVSGTSATITNSGDISGAQFGVVTYPVYDPETDTLTGTVADSTIVNSGTITGENDDGIRLAGGGTITNSGTIQGLAQNAFGGTDGVSIFAHNDQDLATYSGTLINEEGGVISGVRSGAALSSGGTVTNAGTITGEEQGVFIQGNALDGVEREGQVATLTNSGTISGTGNFGGTGQGGHGVSFGSNLDTATLTNSGTITSAFAEGVSQGSLGDLTITNEAEGVIEGATSGIYGGSEGTMTIVNAGTIRGNGAYDGFDAPPDAGITIATADSSVTNSGTITGAGSGITSAYVYDEEVGDVVGRAVGTQVTNSGTIAGESNDGVRLIGGGTVTNSGTISGAGAPFADGISMYAFADQAKEEFSAAVVNQEGGEVDGERFGVIFSGGGSVDNAGTIAGVAGGIFLQGTALDSEEDRSDLTATVVNSGTIEGTGEFGGTYTNGFGVGFGSDLAAATLTNSGTITSAFAEGVMQGSTGALTITNEAGGTIEGATSGIYGGSEGTMTIVNAGTIRGNGAYDGFDAPPDAGITIATKESSVTNSGTISGAGAGITTAYVFDEAINELIGAAVGTQVTNSGTILGESNDGVRLIGGGTVANSGTITGEGSDLSDGVSMFRFEGQSADGYAAVLTNAADGAVNGARFGAILSGGGTIENAGTITGEGAGGVLIQPQGIEGETGITGTIANSGTIAGTSGYGAVILVTDTGTLTNSGTISGATFGAVVEAAESPTEATRVATLTNSGTVSGAGDFGVAVAGFFDEATVANSGTITGASHGLILGNLGNAALTNTGTISGGELGVWGDGSGPVVLDNAGTISGGSGVAVLLGGFDDSVTLRTGSAISGAVDAGEGIDSLVLDGEVLELTEEQQLGASVGFESLAVASGYWTTTGMVGEFATVTIGEAGSLQVNEVDLGEDGFSSPILTSAVTTNGLLVLNFSEDDLVSELDTLTIDGTGGLELIGEAVFTVDTDTLTYTGGTTISNGGLVLTGTLQGDVTTAGDGFFELGAGGTEGTFSGDIVNDGRFVFNRSDDYDFLGAFSGSGVLDKHGAGVLTFEGDYAFQGVTNIFGGAVRIGGIIDPGTDFNLGSGGTLDITGNDQTVGGLEGEDEATVELGEQTLTVDQEENTEFAGTIGGLGGIVKQGDGILNLTGNSTYTGPTEVNGGKLAVNGSIVSNVTVNAGGTLGGNGSVGDTTIGGQGTLAPGNSIGRLTVAGDLNFAAGSIYEVEVNAAGEADRVDATGEVTIASTAGVAVLAEEGNYAPRTDYVILTGAEGITGTFGSVTTDLAFLDPLLRYGANEVTLSLYRNDVDFADVAANANQVGVAGAVQALGIDNPLFEAVLMQNAAAASATFGDLSGEINASTLTGLTDDSRHLRGALLGMAAPEAAGTFIWGSAFGGWGDFDASTDSFGMETDHKGLVAGVGFGGERFAVALSGGIGGSDFNRDGRSDAASVDSKYLAAHATVGAAGGFHGAAGIAYAWHEVETTRSVTGAPLSQTLTSDRDATTLQVFGELGYDLMAGTTAITPFARLAHVSTESDAFAETGGSAALEVAKADQETTFLSLGAKARFNAGQQGFQPYLSAAWNHAFGDRAAQLSSQFAAGGPVFSVVGTAIPKDSAEVEAGFDYTSGAFTIGAAYSGTLASDRTSHGARVTARFVF
ncbi:autotransporter domain-containing protein [Pelagerythrobacter aerophilus]